MTTHFTQLLLLMSFIFWVGPARSQTGRVTDEKPLAKVTLEDFAWLTGRWHGQLAKVRAEQICSGIDRGQILCMFRLGDEKQTFLLELTILQQTASGIEMRSIHLQPDLVEKKVPKPLVFTLAKFSSNELIFSGPEGGEVKRSILQRTSDDVMEGRVELNTPNGEEIIQVHWTRQPHAGQAPAASSLRQP